MIHPDHNTNEREVFKGSVADFSNGRLDAFLETLIDDDLIEKIEHARKGTE
jgi:hypothetical protein